MSGPELVAVTSDGQRIPLTRNPDGSWSGQTTGAVQLTGITGWNAPDDGEIIPLVFGVPQPEDRPANATVTWRITGEA